MPIYAREAWAKLAIVNLTPTFLDHQAIVVIHAKAGEIMTRVMERVKQLSPE